MTQIMSRQSQISESDACRVDMDKDHTNHARNLTLLPVTGIWMRQNVLLWDKMDKVKTCSLFKWNKGLYSLRVDPLPCE